MGRGGVRVTTLRDLRAAVIVATNAVEGITTYDHVPARITPPALIVLPGSPYIVPGDVFGTFRVNHSVSLVSQNGTNETISGMVDDLIEATLLALVGNDISIDTVSTFYTYESNGAQYLAVDITVNDNIQL